MKYIRLLNNIITSYFAVWIIIFSVFSFYYPFVFDGLDHLIIPALGLVMLGMGMTLDTADFARILQRPRDVSIGIMCQYILMPFLGFLIATSLRVDPLIATGVVLLGSCPGGTASNVITFLSKGDLALSVTMTLCSTLLSPILIPLSMYGYAGQWIDVPASKLFISSLQIVVVPVFAGVLIGRLLSNKKKYVTPFLPTLSSAGIILIVAVIVSLNTGSIASLGIKLMAIVVLHNTLGLVSGYSIARIFGMDKKKARTVSIEVGMQNSGLGVVLANSNFGPLTALPSAIFSIWHNISGSILAFIWSRKGTNE